MTNIAELLKDAPKGMKLYSPLFGEVKFVGIDKQSGYPIDVTDCNGNGKSFTEFGVYFADHPDSECLLFPNKDCRTWEGWKLPVEPKFKVGDWLYHNTHGVHPILVKDYGKVLGYKVECIETTYYLQKGVIENEYHLWSIQDAKDGDVLVNGGFIFIFKNIDDGNGVHYYCAYEIRSHEEYEQFHIACFNSLMGRVGNSYTHYTPATKQQRNLLFAKMKDAGYEWDADKKELKKIPKHYDISNFHAGMPVLVRDNKKEWRYVPFSHITNCSNCWRFNAVGTLWQQCIPFEDNEHLLGTTDMCDEQYINW